MATNSEVIQDALGLIGVTDDFSLNADYGALGLRAMNDLLKMWEANEVDVGYYEQDTLTDDNPVEAEHLLAVKYNLAIALAPYFGAEPRAALIAAARASYDNLLRAEQESRLNEVDTPHISRGETWGSMYDIETDN